MITDKPYQHERVLFGAALTHNPEELANRFSEHRSVEMFSRRAAGYIADQLTGPAISYRRFLHAGIHDTYMFYNCILRVDIDGEQRQRIANHPKTFKRLVDLAMHSEYDVAAMSDGYIEPGYELAENGEYITSQRMAMLRPDHGCPFAGNNHDQAIDPLFKKFVPWATTLVFTHHDLVYAS